MFYKCVHPIASETSKLPGIAKFNIIDPTITVSTDHMPSQRSEAPFGENPDKQCVYQNQ